MIRANVGRKRLTSNPYSQKTYSAALRYSRFQTATLPSFRRARKIRRKRTAQNPKISSRSEEVPSRFELLYTVLQTAT